MRRNIYILIGIVLIAFGIGIYSLVYYDGFRFSDINNRGMFNIKSNDSNVKIGDGGIEVVDGKTRVSVGWNGIEVRDGDNHVNVGFNGIKVHDGKDNVNIGLDGIKVDDGKNRVNIGSFGNWFGITPRNLDTFNIDEVKNENIDKVDSIKIVSSFIDVKLISEDRDDIKIHYHGTMKSNILPLLEVEKMGGQLQIKLTTNKNNYTVADSNVILEVIVPKIYNENYSVTTSSSDIYALDVKGKYIDLTSSSGDISFNKSEVNNIRITTSSGNITTKEILGDINITSSSGGIVLTTDNNTGDVILSTSSGDVDVFIGAGSNLSVSGTTSSGDIRSNTPINVHQDKTGRFDFTVGTGEKNMKITTSSGDVYFK